jgi:hypothetical protein
MKRAFFAVALVCGLASGAFADGPGLAADDKAALQAAMYQHIDSQLVNGAFPRLDMGSESVEQLAVTKAHPMILRMGEHFVLCSDFRSAAGKDVPIDFYVARQDVNFVVFHTEIANRAPLEKMVSAGKVQPVD